MLGSFRPLGCPSARRQVSGTEHAHSVQSGAKGDGNPGIYGNPGIAESATYRF